MDYTPILKLALPPFDDVPWDEAVNGDFSILDAAVGRFFGVANLVGIWKNATAYTAGQSVVDDSDGSMWTCAISHTSAASPMTFSQDRGANPGFWTMIASTAQDYAQQAAASSANAANSASAAAMSASNAANSAAVVVGALPLTGGTMTGPIILSADPSNVLGAATKQYVDARVGGTGFLPLSGGTLTGSLTLSGTPSNDLHAASKLYVDNQVATRLSLSGGTLTGQLTVGGNGIQYALGTGHYYSVNWTGSRLQAFVDGVNRGNVAIGDYLPITGGTLSGALTAASYTISIGAYWASDASYTYFAFDSTNWRWQYTRSNGSLSYMRGYDGTTLFTIDPSGNAGYAGGLIAGGSITATAGFAMNQAGANGTWIADGSNVYLRFSGAWGFLWSRSTGRLYFENNNGTPLTALSESGTGIQFPQVSGNFFAWTWDGYATQTIVDGSSLGYNMRSFSNGGITATYQMGLNGSVSQVYAWYVPGVVVAWNYSPSDRRLKKNIEPSTFDALAAINQLQVRSFDLTVPIPDAVSMHWNCGLIADEVKDVMPDIYIPATEEGAYEMIRELPLLAALVRAVQQLSEQVTALGSK